MFVLVLVTVTEAPGRTPPDSSFTVPEIEPRKSCAARLELNPATNTSDTKTRTTLQVFMVPPFQTHSAGPLFESRGKIIPLQTRCQELSYHFSILLGKPETGSTLEL